MPVRAKLMAYCMLIHGAPPCLCGRINLTSTAEYTLHTPLASSPPIVPIEPLAQLRQVIHAKRRATGRNSSECVNRKQVRDVGRKGLQSPVRVIVGDSFLSPGSLPGDYLILIAGQRMKRMSDAEPTT